MKQTHWHQGLKCIPYLAKTLMFFSGEYGNAVLSKYPIIHSENRKLPSLDNSEQRGILAAWI